MEPSGTQGVDPVLTSHALLVLCCIAMHCAVLHCTALLCTGFFSHRTYCIVMYCTALQVLWQSCRTRSACCSSTSSPCSSAHHSSHTSTASSKVRLHSLFERPWPPLLGTWCKSDNLPMYHLAVYLCRDTDIGRLWPPLLELLQGPTHCLSYYSSSMHQQ